MAVVLILRKQEYQLEGTMTVKEALKRLNLSPESHLVVRNGELLNENDVLRDGDVVKIVPSISGGGW
ncbi:MoaD/ThiS family protein [Thermanaerothrix sp.]|jgi:sulfur carrier protein|uniref:MoaD/ThiS family protein n=1 Tax=Thermanaerothrix sp. TaxID=2972675 RepID=UPI002ADDC782|nr:MoaD/ThiS family protein [Thermanaerothrix sp.]